MKKSTLYSMLPGLAWITIAFMGLPAAPPLPPDQQWSEKGPSLVVWSERLALRNAPSIQGGILTLLYEGEAVIFLDETSQPAGGGPSWMKVAVTGGLNGWVPREGIKFGAVVSPRWGGAAETVAQATDDFAVYLCAGEYHETLLIKGKKGLHIKGDDGAVLAGDDANALITIEDSSGVVMENLHVKNASGDMVSVKNSQEVSILRCDLEGPGGICLRAEKSSYIVLRDSRLHHASRGCLSFSGCSELRITKNVIHSNGGAVKSSPGVTCLDSVIFMKKCAYAVFKQNTVVKNHGLVPAIVQASKGIAMVKNIFFLNCVAPDFGAMKVSNQSNWTGDPLFADPDADDFRLRADSPLAEKGKVKAGALGVAQ